MYGGRTQPTGECMSKATVLYTVPEQIRYALYYGIHTFLFTPLLLNLGLLYWALATTALIAQSFSEKNMVNDYFDMLRYTTIGLIGSIFLFVPHEEIVLPDKHLHPILTALLLAVIVFYQKRAFRQYSLKNDFGFIVFQTAYCVGLPVYLIASFS